MSTDYGTTRWWENYLVRYLMPSIAGVVIVSWLCSHGGDQLREILLLPPSLKAAPGSTALQPRIDATSLTLLFLYGNIFCYIASYPILVFHVTRVIDFPDGKWSLRLRPDGYLATVVLVILSFILFHLPAANWRYRLAYILAVLIVCIQLRRLYLTISGTAQDFPGLSKGTVSDAYAFAFTLARRRGVVEVEKTGPAQTDISQSTAVVNDDEKEVTNERQIAWRQEIVATYRHMREHGNSAFIFLLELALAALTYCVITKPGQSGVQQLGAVGSLFALWASPSVFVHLLGQFLERRFSKFDFKRPRVQAREIKPATPK